MALFMLYTVTAEQKIKEAVWIFESKCLITAVSVP